MKRKLSIMLTAFLTVCVLMCQVTSISVFAEEESGTISVSVDKTEVKPGDTVVATVNMTGNPGIVSVNVEVNYDTNNLTLVAVENFELLSGANFDSDYTTAPYVLSWMNNTATENFTSDGVLATLTFTVNEGAPQGMTSISLSANSVNVDLENVVFNTTDCEINISEATVEPKPTETDPIETDPVETEPQVTEPQTTEALEDVTEPTTTQIQNETMSTATKEDESKATVDTVGTTDIVSSTDAIQTGQSVFAVALLAVMILAAAVTYTFNFIKKRR